ncbi:MAG: hypothetical protein LC624_11805, partial [Halobacteriales archaeon]|nr:hypothetical protein [Halobacteriales archaeon]
MVRMLALALLLAMPVGQALVLEDPGSATLRSPSGAQVARAVLLDAWDAGEAAHVVRVRWLGEGLPGTEARLRPATGSGAWTALGATGLSWSVASDYRSTDHGWDGQQVLELRFAMPPAQRTLGVLVESDGEPAALSLWTTLLPDAPAIPSPAAQVGVVGAPRPAEPLWD